MKLFSLTSIAALFLLFPIMLLAHQHRRSTHDLSARRFPKSLVRRGACHSRSCMRGSRREPTTQASSSGNVRVNAEANTRPSQPHALVRGNSAAQSLSFRPLRGGQARSPEQEINAAQASSSQSIRGSTRMNRPRSPARGDTASQASSSRSNSDIQAQSLLRAKNKLMRENPVSVSLRTKGPATVKGWEGNAGTNAPRIPAGKTLTMALSHPEAARIHVEHEDRRAKTWAIANGRVVRGAALEAMETVLGRPFEYHPRTRIARPPQGDQMDHKEERAAQAWGKVVSPHITKPAHIIGELHGKGKFAMEAMNSDSGSSASDSE